MDLPLAAIEPNAFHIIGGLFAVWAVVLGFLGFTRPDFPGNGAGQRAVMAISLTLMLAALSSAIITALNEDEEPAEGHGGEQVPAGESAPQN